MQSFSSAKYRVIGFMTVSIDGAESKRWVLETIQKAENQKPFIPTRLIVESAKYFDVDRIFYLNADGTSYEKAYARS